jgi:hypothetical protein
MQNYLKILAFAAVIAGLMVLAWLMRGKGAARSASTATVSNESLPAALQANDAASQPQAGQSNPAPSAGIEEETSDPKAELAAALQLQGGVDRLNALDNVLTRWAARSPAEALAWARAQNPAIRQLVISFALRGMGTQPREAIRLGLLLISQEPQKTDDYALAVVEGLDNARQFAAALQFADSVSSDSKSDWLDSIFKSWGAADPDAALRVLAAEPPATHDALFQALADGWAFAQPATLADRALSMPPGQDRQTALSFAVLQWSQQDPAAFSAWLSRQQPMPEFDQFIADFVKHTDSANRPPQAAMDLVQKITDPALRVSAAKTVALQWSKDDPAGAATYVQSASWLDPAQRNELLQDLRAAPQN